MTFDEGKLWSLFRRLLSQGGDIQLDYQAGKYKCYEEYSARLDGAARERVEEFLASESETGCDLPGCMRSEPHDHGPITAEETSASTWTCEECGMRGRPADVTKCANCGAEKTSDGQA
jgi:hypothetical protein